MAEVERGTVRVLLFGSLREQLGHEIIVDGDTAGTVAELWSVVTRDRPHLRGRRESVRAACNLAYCGWEDPVRAGDEVAFMPPVSGGSEQSDAGFRLLVRVTRDAIDLDGLIAAVQAASDGAVASFLGIVRAENKGKPVLGLDYEAYEPMAEIELQRIAGTLARQHQLGGIAIVHRIGSLLVGEASLAVVAASPHRVAAFEACREAVEMIKRDVPVWKREHHPDGAEWVDARELEEQRG